MFSYSRNYLSRNNNRRPSSSSLSLSSDFSSLFLPSRDKRKTTLSKRVDSLSIVLHALNPRKKPTEKHHRRTKDSNKNHPHYRKETSKSSYLPISHLMTKKTRPLLASSSSFQYDKDRTSSDSISDLNIQNFISNSCSKRNASTPIRMSTVGTQTEKNDSVSKPYSYGNLRRVNSDLLDYMFLPIVE